MKKTGNISIKYVLAILGALAYIIFCFIFDVHKGVSFYQTTARNYSHSDDSKPTLLSEEEIDIDKNLISVKNQVVVLDTIIYRIDRTDKGTFLIGRVVCDNQNRIMVKLALDKQEGEDYASLVFRKVRLKAGINKIRGLPYEEELYTFDNSLVWRQLNYDYILEGTLEEVLVEYPIDG